MKLKQYPAFWFIGLLLAGMILTAGCSSGVAETPGEEEISATVTKVEDVTAQEAYSLVMENIDNPDFITLDIRTPEEYNDGHVEGARNVNFYATDFSAQLDALDKSKTYLLYCRSGNRSGQALVMMEDRSFLKIYHMSGGIIEWDAEGLPTVK